MGWSQYPFGRQGHPSETLDGIFLQEWRKGGVQSRVDSRDLAHQKGGQGKVHGSVVELKYYRAKCNRRNKAQSQSTNLNGDEQQVVTCQVSQCGTGV